MRVSERVFSKVMASFNRCFFFSSQPFLVELECRTFGLTQAAFNLLEEASGERSTNKSIGAMILIHKPSVQRFFQEIGRIVSENTPR